MENNLESKQLKFRVFKKSKNVLSGVILIAVFILMFLPFWTIFQDVLTKLVMRIEVYRSIQDVIVPYELKTVGSILTILGFPIRVGNSYMEWTKAAGGREAIYLAWNCVGWQSVILFIITLVSGLSGKHKLTSKLEVLTFGILGTYLINIFRLGMVVVVYFYLGRPLGIPFHDYFSNIITLIWLFVFWWYSYKFILIEKKA